MNDRPTKHPKYIDSHWTVQSKFSLASGCSTLSMCVLMSGHFANT